MYLGLTSLGLRPAPFAASPITQLFQSGEPGAVFIAQKPSEWASADLVTMFTDVFGTTPVTALEQTVAMHLDTRPIFLGPNLASTYAAPAGFDNVVTVNSATSFTSAVGTTANRVYANIPGAVAGKTYEVVGTSDATSAGAFIVFGRDQSNGLGSTINQTTQINPGLSFQLRTTCTASGQLSFLWVAASSSYRVNNIQIREVISAPNTVGQPLRGPQMWNNANVSFTGTSSQVSPGVYRIFTADGTNTAVFTDIVANPGGRMILGAWYEATFNIDSVTTAGTGLTVDSGLGGGPAISATVGPKRCIFQAANASAVSIKRGSGITDIQISNLSFKLLYGNHRSQSSSGARPRLSARYNKVTARNANPTDLTGLNKGGDAAATLTVVNDAAALAAAGLDRICTLGNVYKLDNSAGVANAFAYTTATVGNLCVQSITAYARVTGGSAVLGMSGSSTGNRVISGSSYQAWAATSTPDTITRNWQILVAAGAIVYFILMDMRDQCYSYLPAPQVILGTGSSASDYDDTGFPARLVYGTSGMVTGTVDFSACQQSQLLWAGAKLSDAAIGVMIEGGTVTNFSLSGPRGAGVGNYGLDVRAGGAIATRNSFGNTPAPHAGVITGLSDTTQATIATQAVVRINGIDVSSTATGTLVPAGSPLTAAAIAYGSRNGDGATIPLVGDEFISIVRGGSTPVTGTVYQIEQSCARYMGMNI